MKQILSILLLLIPITLLSQEIDEEYLDSLPEGVKEDVIERMEAEEEAAKPVYRRASTMIDKEEEEEEDMKKREVFGYEFFDTMQSSFMPTNEPNLDASYILDFGDVVEIQLVGQKDLIDSYPIKRDGSINIPDIGRVVLAGLPLKDASSLINNKANETYIGTKAFVSLKNIRDIQVIITGNAYNPGIYTLNGNSNILHAVTMAGGIDEKGSFRDIKLIRNNQVIETLDLYDLFIYGFSSINKRLRTGDSILVAPRLNIVNVLSGVNRPKKYEMRDDETYEDLLKFANGITSTADLDNVTLQRLDKNEVLIFSPSFEELKLLSPKNNDSLSIREYKYGSVDENVAVKKTGNYKIRNWETLSDLILRAGGYEDYAYPFGGFLNNLRSEEINKISRERLYDQFLRNLIDNAGIVGDATDPSIGLVLEELRTVKDSGRVIAEFDLDAIQADPKLDTILEDGDDIFIPTLTQQVYIYGEVNNQGAIRYTPNEGVSYYIEGSGGFLSSADRKTIFIVHPNGKTESLSPNSRALSFANNNNSDLVYPGSIIYVPRSAEITSTVQTAAIWAPIISGLALSLASVSSLNNN